MESVNTTIDPADKPLMIIKIVTISRALSAFLISAQHLHSWRLVEIYIDTTKKIRAVFLKNFGKSQALHAGFEMAQGDVVITMDADLQDNPEEIPELFNLIKDNNIDLVSGWKKVRYDSVISKNLPSKLFNWAARKTSGVKLHDFNCGLKAYKRKVINAIDIYGGLHRYIPAIAGQKGFSVTEIEVSHRSRSFGKTKYGGNRFF